MKEITTLIKQKSKSENKILERNLDIKNLSIQNKNLKSKIKENLKCKKCSEKNK